MPYSDPETVTANRTRPNRFLTTWETWDAAEENLAAEMPNTSIAIIRAAWEYAVIAHGSQQRPMGGAYTGHLIEVLEVLYRGEGVRDTTTLVAALLHDVLEDTDKTTDDLRTHFGPLVTDVVRWLTIPSASGMSREEIRRVAFARLAHAPAHVRRIKLADRYASVQRLDATTRADKQARRFRETVNYIMPLAISFPFFAAHYRLWRSAYAYLNEIPEPSPYSEAQHAECWSCSIAPQAPTCPSEPPKGSIENEYCRDYGVERRR